MYRGGGVEEGRTAGRTSEWLGRRTTAAQSAIATHPLMQSAKAQSWGSFGLWDAVLVLQLCQEHQVFN